MASPLAQGEGATEIICEELISQPYVAMTVRLMELFNVKVRASHKSSSYIIYIHKMWVHEERLNC